jgi:hypothetical protein
MSDLIPSFFIGGPVGLVLAGVLGYTMQAGLAVLCGAVVGEILGLLVIRSVRGAGA